MRMRRSRRSRRSRRRKAGGVGRVSEVCGAPVVTLRRPSAEVRGVAAGSAGAEVAVQGVCGPR